jgi:23S rRNA (pseudouridine1915-N3)-methyltransferase
VVRRRAETAAFRRRLNLVRLILACVGRGAKSPEQELCDQYLKRASVLGPRLGFSRIELSVVEISRAASAPARMKEEAEKLVLRLPQSVHHIALDEAGRTRSSEDFARHLASLRDRSVGDIAFFVGGPDGLAREFRDGASERMAFGAQTWPHLLVRAMLAEQLYRAMTILAGHPYHRGR